MVINAQWIHGGVTDNVQLHTYDLSNALDGTAGGSTMYLSDNGGGVAPIPPASEYKRHGIISAEPVNTLFNFTSDSGAKGYQTKFTVPLDEEDYASWSSSITEPFSSLPTSLDPDYTDLLAWVNANGGNGGTLVISTKLSIVVIATMYGYALRFDFVDADGNNKSIYPYYNVRNAPTDKYLICSASIGGVTHSIFPAWVSSYDDGFTWGVPNMYVSYTYTPIPVAPATHTNEFYIMNWYDLFTGATPPEPPEPPEPEPEPEPIPEYDRTSVKPYGEDSDSTTHDSDGSFDFTGDSVTVPTIPAVNVLSDNLITCLLPTQHNMQMFSNAFATATIKQALLSLLGDEAMDAFISLKIFPFQITGTLMATDVAMGGVPVLNNLTGDDRVPATDDQHRTLDFGSISFETPLRGNWVDYEPYTKIKIHLPWIGEYSIDASDVWYHTVSVAYVVDILTGDCVAFVASDNMLRYTFNGNCGTDIPFSAKTSGYSKMIAGMGASVLGVMGMMTGNPTAMIAGAGASIGGMATAGMSHDKTVSAGKLGESCAMMSGTDCYLIVDTPIEKTPVNAGWYKGYKSSITQQIGLCKGYVKVSEVNIENVPALSDELNEIETLLKGGVLL